uniref:Inward rectifier potassium channel C-terminal domain-containing protein n=1 Tax=Panagrolaimus sp. JU765 TaxID=591449 RepID=A0AC34QLD2_9BILA
MAIFWANLLPHRPIQRRNSASGASATVHCQCSFFCQRIFVQFGVATHDWVRDPVHDRGLPAGIHRPVLPAHRRRPPPNHAGRHRDRQSPPAEEEEAGDPVQLADVQHRLYLAESHVRMYMAVTRVNPKGEKELVGVKDINVGYDSGFDRVLLLWPVIIRHIIDEDSPLYGMSPEIMRQADFELILTCEGIVEATGMTFQARTSFIPNEIQWGHRFTSIVVLNDKTGKFQVDYSNFEMTERCDDFFPVPTPESDDDNKSDIIPRNFDHSMHNTSGFV